MTEYLKQSRTMQRQKVLFVYAMVVILMIGLAGRLLYLMINRADYYGEKAKEVHQRQRVVKAARNAGREPSKVSSTNFSLCTAL